MHPTATDSGNAVMRTPILYISMHAAGPTLSGQLLMHRHLARLGPEFQVERAHSEIADGSHATHIRLRRAPLYHRLRKTRWGSWVEAADALIGWSFAASVRAAIARARPNAVVSIAEMPLLRSVQRAVARSRNPLITIVHDWSTLWLDIPPAARKRVDAAFVAACCRSTITLNVSREFAELFGGGNTHRVLPPIPGTDSPPTAPLRSDSRFHIVYAGNFEYFQTAEMVELCAELLRRRRPDLLRVWGPQPDLRSANMHSVAEANVYAGIARPDEIGVVLANAGALLVICPFGDRWRHFSEFSFPSKLAEYCRFGRPIVVWAPPYAAAARWARESSAAILVDIADPKALVSAILDLERDNAAQRTFGAAAQREAATTFCPERLQQVFENALRDAASQTFTRQSFCHAF